MAEHTIPTIDLTPLRTGTDADKRKVARQIDEACRDTGFFLVTGHGVPADLITKTRQRAIDFFALPAAEKLPPTRLHELSTIYSQYYCCERAVLLRFAPTRQFFSK